jgi:hypothetical protein
MVYISLILYTKGFFGSFLKSPTQMGSLSINNSVTNISRLGTFKIKKMCSFKRDNLHLKNTPDALWLRRMRQKRRIPWCWGGGGTRWQPKPSSPLPSGRFKTWVIKRLLNLASLANQQTPKVAVGPKLTDGPCVAVTWLLCKVAKSPPIP